jgi:hypothetical protein
MSTSVTAPAKSVDGRRRQSKQRDIRRPIKTIRSTDWKLVESIFEPLHARFNFTLEGCTDDEGLNSHNDLPHSSPSDSVLQRDLRGE